MQKGGACENVPQNTEEQWCHRKGQLTWAGISVLLLCNCVISNTTVTSCFVVGLVVVVVFNLSISAKSFWPYKLPHSEVLEVSMCTSLREGALFFVTGPLQRSNDIMHMKYLAQFPAHSNNSINVYSLPSNY